MSAEVAGRLVGIVAGRICIWPKLFPAFRYELTATEARQLARRLEDYAGQVDSARIRRWVRRGQYSPPVETILFDPPVVIAAGETLTVSLTKDAEVLEP